jgi:hypothetical protein
MSEKSAIRALDAANVLCAHAAISATAESPDGEHEVYTDNRQVVND